MRPRSRLRWTASAWVLTAVAVACSHKPLPPAAGLLHRAAAVMRTVRTVRFVLTLQGSLGPYSIRRADGALTRDGEMVGSVSLEQGGSLIEYQLVIAAGSFYLKGPTGGFQTVPAALAERAYDPRRLLDPETGAAHILETATGGRTVAAQSVAGVAAYLVDARITVEALGDLMPLGANLGSVPAAIWIGANRPVLLQVRIISPATEGEEATTLTLTLRDVNEPITITPPSA